MLFKASVSSAWNFLGADALEPFVKGMFRKFVLPEKDGEYVLDFKI